MSDAFSRAARRTLDRLGRTVTVENRSAQTDSEGNPLRDDHGNIKWRDPSTSEVSAEIVYRGTPAFSRRADGVDTNVDALIFAKRPSGFGEDGYNDGVYGVILRDGSAGEQYKATRVVDGAEAYVIRDIFDENNGLVRAHAGKED